MKSIDPSSYATSDEKGSRKVGANSMIEMTEW